MAFDARRARRLCWRCALHLPRYSSTSPAGIPNNLQNTEGVPYSQALQWDVENRSRSQSSNIPPIDTEPVSRSSRESDPGSSQTVHRFRIRGTNRSRPMFLGTRSQSQSRQPIRRVMIEDQPVRRVMIEDRPVSKDAQSQSSSAQAVRKRRIRRIKFQLLRRMVVGNTRLISLGTRSQSQSRQPIRRVMIEDQPIRRVTIEGRPVSLDAQSQSSSAQAVRKPRIRRIKFQRFRRRVVGNTRLISLGIRSQSEAVRKPRIRGILDGRPVSLDAQSQSSDTRSPSQSMSAVQQTPTRESSEGGSVPLGTQEVLCFRKQDVTVIRKVVDSFRKVVPESKHELDPVMALDTRSPSQSMSAAQQSSSQESSEDGFVPSGTREVLRSRKEDVAGTFRKVVTESKHEMDPVIALDTRSPSQSTSAVQQSPTQESSEGGLVPLGSRVGLRFSKEYTAFKKYAALVFRKIFPESKHELDPVMALDTRSPSQSMRAVQQSPTQESSEGGSVHAVGAEATSPAKRKTKIVDIKRLKYGARRLVTNSIIRKHIVSANKSGANIRGTNVHYVMSYLNRDRIIRRILRDPHHTKTPRILYLAGRDDATRLVRKAGPPLRERPTDAGQVPSKDQHEDEAYHKALTLLLDSSRNLHTSEPPNPTREIKKRRHFSSQHWTLRRVVSSESRTSNRQSLVSKRSFSTRTPRNPKRHHATATVSNREAALGFHMLKPSTESDLAG